MKSTQYIVSYKKRPYKLIVSLIAIWSFLFTQLFYLSSLNFWQERAGVIMVLVDTASKLRPVAVAEREGVLFEAQQPAEPAVIRNLVALREHLESLKMWFDELIRQRSTFIGLNGASEILGPAGEALVIRLRTDEKIMLHAQKAGFDTDNDGRFSDDELSVVFERYYRFKRQYVSPSSMEEKELFMTLDEFLKEDERVSIEGIVLGGIDFKQDPLAICALFTEDKLRHFLSMEDQYNENEYSLRSEQQYNEAIKAVAGMFETTREQISNFFGLVRSGTDPIAVVLRSKLQRLKEKDLTLYDCALRLIGSAVGLKDRWGRDLLDIKKEGFPGERGVVECLRQASLVLRKRQDLRKGVDDIRRVLKEISDNVERVKRETEGLDKGFSQQDRVRLQDVQGAIDIVDSMEYLINNRLLAIEPEERFQRDRRPTILEVSLKQAVDDSKQVLAYAGKRLGEFQRYLLTEGTKIIKSSTGTEGTAEYKTGDMAWRIILEPGKRPCIEPSIFREKLPQGKVLVDVCEDGIIIGRVADFDKLVDKPPQIEGLTARPVNEILLQHGEEVRYKPKGLLKRLRDILSPPTSQIESDI